MRLFREGKQGSSRKSDWSFMERFEIPSVDKPLENHVVRYRIIGTPWGGIYLHQFVNADVRTFHDHPWNFVSVILRGGYVEATPPTSEGVGLDRTATLGGFTTKWAGSFNRKRATDLHYIADLLRTPTWTLIFVGRRQRVWGYVDEAGWTAFNEHPHALKFDEALRLREEQAS